MNYEEFKEKILEAVRNIYGNDVEVDITRLQRHNRQDYDGIYAASKDTGDKLTPVIGLGMFYEEYSSGVMDMDECASAIYRELKRNEATESMINFKNKILDWDSIKGYIYPILLSTKENEELLEKLVSMPMLDLSVAYIIRKEMPNGYYGSVKISNKILECYGISAEELHRQALENLERDGYEFQDMKTLAKNYLSEELSGVWDYVSKEPVEMYILTNSKSFGAAGILNKELIRKFAGKRDYYILPSSLHETIFVPVSDENGKEMLDSMVKEVNDSVLDAEDVLSDHSYFYDANADEIRICA